MLRIRWLLLAFAAVVVVVLAIWRFQSPPEGVQPIVWGRESCRECHMSIDDPSFAAQLQTQDGQVFNFDDPGCLFRYLSRNDPSIHAVYFHAVDGEEWLRRDAVAFVTTDHSPMDYDLGAVPRGTSPNAQSFQQVVREWHDRDGPEVTQREQRNR